MRTEHPQHFRPHLHPAVSYQLYQDCILIRFNHVAFGRATCIYR